MSLHLFNDAAKAATVAIRCLADWHRLAIRANLAVIGALAVPIPVISYWREVAYRVHRIDRFEEMCAYLDRRGRAAAKHQEEVGR